MHVMKELIDRQGNDSADKEKQAYNTGVIDELLQPDQSSQESGGSSSGDEDCADPMDQQVGNKYVDLLNRASWWGPDNHFC